MLYVVCYIINFTNRGMIKNKAILFFLLIIGITVPYFAMAVDPDELKDHEVIKDTILPLNLYEYTYDEHVVFTNVYELLPQRAVDFAYMIDDVVLHSQQIANCVDTSLGPVSLSWDAGSVTESAEDEPFVFQIPSNDLQLVQMSVTIKECDTSDLVGLQIYTIGNIKVGFEPKPYLDVSPEFPGPVTVVEDTTPNIQSFVVKNTGPLGTTLTGTAELKEEDQYFSVCALSDAADSDCINTTPSTSYNLTSNAEQTVRVKFAPPINTGGVGLGTLFLDFIKFTCASEDPTCGGGVLEEEKGLVGYSKLPGEPEVDVFGSATGSSISTLNFSPPYIEVDSTNPEGEAEKSVWVKNIGASPLSGVVTNTTDFQCVGGCTYTNLPAGDTQEVIIKFDPSSPSTDTTIFFNQTITFTAVDSDGDPWPAKDLIVKGIGITEPILKVINKDYPLVSLPVISNVNFVGTYYIGEVWETALAISNIGGFDMDGDIAFESSDPGITCEAIGGCGSYNGVKVGGLPYNFTVKFDPQTTGPKYATTTVTVDGSTDKVVTTYTMLLISDIPEIKVTSEYDDSDPVSDWHIQAPVVFGANYETEFYIENVGAKSLTGTISILDTSGDAGQFVCISDCSYNLGNGDPKHTATFKFIPSATNGVILPGATATFPNNDDISDFVEVDMYSDIVNVSGGAGFSLGSISFGNVLIKDIRTADSSDPVGETAAVTISNLSDANITVASTFQIPGPYFYCKDFASCNFTLVPGEDRDILLVFDTTSSVASEFKSTILEVEVGGDKTLIDVSGTVIKPDMDVHSGYAYWATDAIDFGKVSSDDIVAIETTASKFYSNDWVVLGDDEKYELVAPYSFSSWIRINTIDWYRDRVIMSKYKKNSNDREWIFGVDTAGKLYFSVSTDGSFANVVTSRSSSLPALDAGTLMHVGVTVDAGGNVLFYYNGGFYSNGSQALPVATHHDIADVRIGALQDNVSESTYQNMTGDIDELRFYSGRVLTSDEFKELGRLPAGVGNVSGPTAHFTMDIGEFAAGQVTDLVSGVNYSVVGVVPTQTGTFYVTNSGLINQGDTAATYNNTITVTVGNGTNFTCIDGCGPVNLNVTPASAIQPLWWPVVIEFNPAGVDQSWEETIPFSYELKTPLPAYPLDTYPGGTARYVIAETSSESLLHVESSYASSSPPGDWDAGVVWVSNEAFTNFYIYNNGVSDLIGHIAITDNTDFSCVHIIDDLGVSHACSTLVSGVDYEFGGALPDMLPIPGGEFYTMQMRFKPLDDIVPDKSSMLTFVNSTDVGNPIDVLMVGSADGEPFVVVTPESGNNSGMDYGTVPIFDVVHVPSMVVADLSLGYNAKILKFKLENSGGGVFSDSIPNTPPFYCINNCNETIDPGDFIYIDIAFVPQDDILYTEQFAFSTNVEAKVTLKGVGYFVSDMLVDPTFIDFDYLLGGEVREETITFSNTLDGIISGRDSISSAFSNSYSCIAGSCLSYTGIETGTDGSVTILYNPQTTATHSIDYGLSGRTNPSVYLPFDNMDFSVRDATFATETYDVSYVGGGQACTFLGSAAPATTTSEVGFGQAMNFATDYYVRVPSVPFIDNDMTISAWIRGTSWGGDQYILQKEIASDNVFELKVNAVGKIEFDFDSSLGAGTLTSASTLSTNTWYHVAITYDRSDIKLYINGSKDMTAPESDLVSSLSGGMNIGADMNGINYFKGAIDEVMVYNRALSDREITDTVGAYKGIYDKGDKVRVNITGLKKIAPVISIPGITTDFGNVRVNTVLEVIFQLKNGGSGFVPAGKLIVSAPFECVNAVDSDGGACDPSVDGPDCVLTASVPAVDPCSFDPIGPDDWVSAIIRFKPISRGIYSGSLVIDSLNNFSIPISGIGYIPAFKYEEI